MTDRGQTDHRLTCWCYMRDLGGNGRKLLRDLYYLIVENIMVPPSLNELSVKTAYVCIWNH